MIKTLDGQIWFCNEWIFYQMEFDVLWNLFCTIDCNPNQLFKYLINNNLFVSVVQESTDFWTLYFSESLILAQNERWRRGSDMQVERDRSSSLLFGRESGERVRNT